MKFQFLHMIFNTLQRNIKLNQCTGVTGADVEVSQRIFGCVVGARRPRSF